MHLGTFGETKAHDIASACLHEVPIVGIHSNPETLSLHPRLRVSRCDMSILDASPACAASDPVLWMQRLRVSEVGPDCPRTRAAQPWKHPFRQESRAISMHVQVSSKVMCFICLM